MEIRGVAVDAGTSIFTGRAAALTTGAEWAAADTSGAVLPQDVKPRDEDLGMGMVCYHGRIQKKDPGPCVIQATSETIDAA